MILEEKAGRDSIALYGARAADGRRAAPGLLALALAETFGLEETPRQVRLPGGKPVFPERPEIHFNISHSGPLALCAVGTAPVGADIEVIRPRWEGLPRRVLSEEEYRWFAGRGGRWADFYTLWTLKEARLKYEGTGLNRSPRAVAVPLLEPGETGEREGLSFRSYGGADWRGCLCAAPGHPLPQRVSGNLNDS